MIEAKRVKYSETLFQRYCERHAYEYARMDERVAIGVRSPDFDVLVSGTRVIVEVKEMEANEEETRLWRETWSGKIVVHGREPGKRARYLIRRATGQLRPYALASIPTVVLLYDNILVDGARPRPPIDLFGSVGPYDIDVALFGLQTANVRLHADGSTESLGDGRNRRRRVADLELISAVAVLYEHPIDHFPFVLTYNNFFAKTPLPPHVFAGTNDRHFTKPRHPDLCPGLWTAMNPSTGQVLIDGNRS